jgi:hypothetical protein
MEQWIIPPNPTDLCGMTKAVHHIEPIPRIRYGQSLALTISCGGDSFATLEKPSANKPNERSIPSQLKGRDPAQVAMRWFKRSVP